ncbi:NTP transferase domain-containing protein [Roseomonas sp. BN140053]|uniref:phosphocholine cytidylyltransferase family protein n=1 Tax=Roseomonas sp. BN140053 TaxID=3391898 RepID=UPI0039E81FD7
MPSTSSSPSIAILLAAGVGRRLGGMHDGPKVLLDMGGRSLLARHLENLAAEGVRELSITVGFQRAAIEAELSRLHWDGEITLVENSRFREGSLVSLHAQAARLRRGSTVVLMDGDVLYDARMLRTLLRAPGENVLLVDRNIEPGDEPVKICFRGDRIVDFRKIPEHAHDRHGESVGFFRFSPAMAVALADRCAAHVAAGRTGLEYEEAIRDLLLAEPERFAAADVSDLPWTEIDFEADVLRARRDILPALRPSLAQPGVSA